MDELISIIIPVYNAEKYIERCIRSVQNQTYTNFELILVNDGSQDSSLNLCKLAAKQDSRIIVLDRKNGGASAARNTGLTHICGHYVVFIDADDYVSPSYLENLYRAAKEGNYDLVQCKLEKTNKTDVQLKTVDYRCADIEEVTKAQALNERRYKVSVWGKIYRAEILNGFRFQEGIIYEDDASYYVFVDRAKRLAILNEILYFYYMSENSVMRNDKKDKSTAFIGIYEDRIRYFKDRGAYDLLEGSYARFCLVLMLSLSGSFLNGNNIGDRKELLSQFNKYYPFVMKAKMVNLKDKVMLTCFRMCPSIVGRIIGIM